MSRAQMIYERSQTALDPIMAAAAAETGEQRNEFVGHVLLAIGEISIQALADAMTADADETTDTLGSAIAWSRARGAVDAIETLRRHIAPDTTDTEIPEETSR